jgi:hypothetical protein
MGKVLSLRSIGVGVAKSLQIRALQNVERLQDYASAFGAAPQ